MTSLILFPYAEVVTQLLLPVIWVSSVHSQGHAVQGLGLEQFLKKQIRLNL